MDLLQNLRLRNLFSGNDPKPSVGFPINTTDLFDPSAMASPAPINPAPVVTNPLNVPDSNLTALRGRARPYMDQYAELLKNQPNRNDYQLSKVGKALAAASGILTGTMQGPERGINVFKNIADEPYNRAQQDYASKAGRTKELAGVEATQLEDQEKLEVAIEAAADKRRDDIRQMIKIQSDVELSDARIKQIEDGIKNGGLKLEVNNITGRRELIDTKTGKILQLNKVSETPGEESDREFTDFKKKFGVEHSGRIQLKGMDQAHDQVMEGIKNSNARSLLGQRQAGDEALVKLKNNLDKLSPTQRNAAFDGAYKQVLLMNPVMKDMLFDIKDGEVTLKKDYNPDVFNLFTGSVQEIMRQNMGEPSRGFTGPIGAPNNEEPISGMAPNTTSRSNIDPARQAEAVAWLTKGGYAVDEANIAEWIKQDDIEKSSSPAPTNVPPQVALPQQVAPQVAAPTNSIFQNFGKPVYDIPTQGMLTLPQQVGRAGNAIGNKAAALRDFMAKIPRDIYGNPVGFNPQNTVR